MKKLAHALLVLAVLAALGWALWRGFQHPRESGGDEEDKSAEATAGDKSAVAEKPDPAQKPETAEQPGATPGEEKKEEHAEFTVHLEKEKWEALGFQMAAPVKAELAPRREAFGRVLDPTALVTLDSDFAAAEAALAASQAENERAQKLLAAGEGTSKKAAETAEAQFRADQIKVASLRRSALLQWGDSIAGLEPAQRHALVEALVHATAALVRVDVLPADALAEPPRAAHLSVLGHEPQLLETTQISPAAEIDPRTQAQGFLLRVEQPPFPLRPGMAVTAWLDLPDKPQPGFAVPRAALLRHDGRTWVYVQKEDDEFVRTPVQLAAPLDGDRGWFVPADGGLTADDHIVLQHPEILLSEELKSAAAEPEEP